MARRDLSAISGHIMQGLGRIIRDAFLEGIDCDILQGGLLAGGSEQTIYEESVTQNYVIGTRRRTPDGRTFVYSKAVGGIIPNHASKYVYEEAVSYAALTATSDVGDETLTFDIAITDGLLGDGAVIVNELAGGFVCIYNTGDTSRQHRGILSNTAVSAGGGEMTITLDGPLTLEGTISTSAVEVLGNPYLGIDTVNDSYTSVMGVSSIVVQSGYFFWLQTWGPVCISPGSTPADPGATAEERGLWFQGQGCIACLSDLTAIGDAENQQYAGFIIQKDTPGAAGPPFLMLQISP